MERATMGRWRVMESPFGGSNWLPNVLISPIFRKMGIVSIKIDRWGGWEDSLICLMDGRIPIAAV